VGGKNTLQVLKLDEEGGNSIGGGRTQRCFRYEGSSIEDRPMFRKNLQTREPGTVKYYLDAIV